MKSRQMLAVQCIFMITCHTVTHGYIYNNFLYEEDEEYNQNLIPGYHIESLGNILNNYESSSYTIKPLGEVLSSLGNNGLVRKKRSFFSNVFPFVSTPNAEITEKSNTAVTKEIKETGDTSTTQTNDITIKETSETFTAQTNDVTIKEPSEMPTTEPDDVITNKEEKYVSIKTDSNIATDTADSISTNTIDGVSTTTTGGVSTDVVNNGGFYNRMKTNVMNIVDMGQNVKNSMVVAAPYLPMVLKIAVYLIPGMSMYQVLLLSVNIANITSQAILHYSQGESMSSVAFDAGTKIAYESMFKRDLGETIGNYATNMYDSFLSSFHSRFGHKTQTTETNKIDKYGTNTETEINTNIIEIPEMAIKSDDEMKTIVANINDENNDAMYQTIPSTLMSRKRELENKFAKMKSFDENSDDTYSESLSNETDESSESEESESNELDEVDQVLFEKLLEESNSVQPEFIQNMSGEQLVNYLEHVEIVLPEPRINSIKVFEALTNNMNFNHSVTDEQVAKLNQMLTKLTDYYIANTLNKQTLTTPTEN